MSKPPTPQGISRLLAKAGFERAEWEREHRMLVCVRDGYRAIKASSSGTAVSVRWSQTAGSARDTGRESVRLSDYADAIAESGWQALRMEREVIVTAGEDTP
jgi:hypothetical protein